MNHRIGKYIIDSLIAEGGMARIYRAHSEGVGGVDKVVALKCLKQSLSQDSSFVQMLTDEARITVRMSHKNICQTYGLERDGDNYFIAMELVNGVSLDKFTRWIYKNRNGFSVEAVVYIISEACAGLSYAHRMTDDDGNPLGIVHRDVNPQNICISKEGEVKLIDFGIAKAKRLCQETMVGTIKGKFNYMSPEQARGDRVDQRADVFALGAVMYELLSGHMLYPLSLNDTLLRSKVRMADYEPIETFLPNLHPTLRKILSKALARDLSQRFATARDFLLALTQFNHDECRVFDSLNMSSLVTHYLEDTKSGLQKAPPAANARITAGKLEAMKTTDASVSAIENSLSDYEGADTLSDINSNIDMENDPTSLYAKKDFDAYLQNRAAKANHSTPIISEINRAVDLDIKKNDDGQTMIVPMSQVKLKPDSHRNNALSAWNKLAAKCSQLSEKTLIIIIIALVLLFAGIFVLVITSNDSDESSNIAALQAVDYMIVSSPSNIPIFIDGKDSGYKTPHAVAHRNGMKVSLHHKLFKDEIVDFATAIDKTVSLDLEPVVQDKSQIMLNINSRPSNGTVYINDKLQSNKTPMFVRIDWGKPCTVRIEVDGYHTSSQTVVWTEDDYSKKSRNLDFKLDKDNSGI